MSRLLATFGFSVYIFLLRRGSLQLAVSNAQSGAVQSFDLCRVVIWMA